MNIVPYRAEHLLRIKAQEAQRYLGPHLTADHAKALEASTALAIEDGDRVLMVGGALEQWAHRAVVWSYLDASAGERFLQIHRATKRFLDALPYNRLEADVDVEFEAGHRWLRLLGFEMEAPRMRRFRVDGGDSALYARVK